MISLRFRRARAARQAALLGGLVFLSSAAAWEFLADDAFITLRYARSWLDGLGLVFNAGERVEGYTNFLWLVVVAGFGKLGADLVVAARVLGLLAALGAVVATGFWAARRERHLGWAALAALLVAVEPSFAAYASAGLETPLFAFLVLASLGLAAREESLRPRLPLSGLAVLLAALCRPEGVVLAPVVLGFQLVCRRREPARDRWAAAAAWCAPLALGLAAHVGWRLWYYGQLLPNTFYAKTGGGLAQVARGLAYLRDALTDHGGPLLVAVAAAALLERRARRSTALLLAGSSALLLAVALEGGDGLPLYRFTVPVLAPLALVLATGLRALTARVAAALSSGERPRALLALGSGALLLAAFAARPRIYPHHEHFVQHRDHQVPKWAAAGRWLRAHAPPGASFAAVPIGAVSYYSELTAIDMVGLTDAHIARAKVEGLGTGHAGHERHDAAYVLSRRPTFLLLANIQVTPKPTGGVLAFTQSSVQWEADLYKHPDVTRLYRSVTARLDTGDYLTCLALEGTVLRP